MEDEEDYMEIREEWINLVEGMNKYEVEKRIGMNQVKENSIIEKEVEEGEVKVKIEGEIKE